MTVIGSPTATGSWQKPAEVEDAKAAGVDWNHIGRYNLIQKDLMDFTGVSSSQKQAMDTSVVGSVAKNEVQL